MARRRDHSKNLRRLARAVQHELSSTGNPYGWSENVQLEQVAELLDRASVTWPLMVTPRPARFLSRTTSMLSGPSYSSRNFPWPRVSGKNLFPAAQLNLIEIATFTGRKLPHGLLQIWFVELEAY